MRCVYRVVRQEDPDTELVNYRVCSVWCNENDEIKATTAIMGTSYGDTPEELREEIKHCLRAFRYPVLEEKEAEEGRILVPTEMENMTKNWHYNELVDRTSVVSDYIYHFLSCHPIIRRNGVMQDLLEIVWKALDVLLDEAGRSESCIDNTDQ